MIYQKIRPLDSAQPIVCACCRTAPADAHSDYCAACIAARVKRRDKRRAKNRTGITRIWQVAVLVVCLLVFSAVVGFFCPAFLQPFVLVSGLCAGIFVAVAILGGGGENAG